jgi:integrase
MARQASVRYWKGRGAYCCWHQGRQLILQKGPDDAPDGPCYRAARERFNEIHFGEAAPVTLDGLAERYLRWASIHRAAGTVNIRQHTLHYARDKFGPRSVPALLSIEIQEWLDSERASGRWGASTARLIAVSLKACLSWGAKGGLIQPHPFAKTEVPPDGSRGLEYALTPEKVATVLEACRRAARDFVQALADTGARPSEITSAEARHYDPLLRALVYQANARPGEKTHKTARTGRPRVVFLSAQTAATVERLIQRYPTGPLFRSPCKKRTGAHRGQRWGWDNDALAWLFRELRRKTGVSPLCAYSFRHTYAVKWLRARKPVEALAEVLGTSVAMIQRHYGHLADQRDYLRRLVDEVAGESPEVKE